MLPNSARIKNSSDFARVTKTGRRSTTNSLIGYLLVEQNANQLRSNQPKLGLIIGKSIGNSVVRNRIARQIRHAAKESLSLLNNGSLLVIRVMTRPENAFTETKELLTKTKNQNTNQVSA